MSTFTPSHSHYKAMYDLYDIRVTYHTDKGIAVAASQTNTRFISLRRPVTYKTVAFVVGRIGEKPELPDPTPEEPGLVLLEEKIGGVAPVPRSSGNLMYVVSGEYRYAFNKPINAPSNYRLASTPADLTDIGENSIEMLQFMKGIT